MQYVKTESHRNVFCERCGGDKPFHREEWVKQGGMAFCSPFCRDVWNEIKQGEINKLTYRKWKL